MNGSELVMRATSALVLTDDMEPYTPKTSEARIVLENFLTHEGNESIDEIIKACEWLETQTGRR